MSRPESARRFQARTSTACRSRGAPERVGWFRGSGGRRRLHHLVSRKAFPAAGVDVVLLLSGMFVGMGLEREIQLDELYFVRAGSVKIGSYTYDEPRDEKDDRVLAFGAVPAIVYSEVLGDLQRIAGKKENE